MKCPVCSDADLVMTERQGVEIDYCPKCRGVWLDRGELDKIIERSDRDDDDYRSRSQPNQGYPQPAHGYPQHKYHKKKSFWHELFD